MIDKTPAISPHLLCSEQWAENEFETANFGHKRLKDRLIKIARQFAAASAANIPQACGEWSQSKAAYRFCDNEAVDPREIIEAHRRATLGRMKDQELILVIQDTTALNFSTHAQTEGLGPIGGNRDKTVGLLAHSLLALDQRGFALGLLGVAVTARDPKSFRIERRKRNCKPIEQKESRKWLEGLESTLKAARELPASCRILEMTDREGDIYEHFALGLEAQRVRKEGARVDLLVRSKHERRIVGSESTLWKGLGDQPARGELVLEVPAKPGSKARQATLSIRWSKVRIAAPATREKYRKHNEDLTLWAIEAREEQVPQGGQPLCWRLLTTLEVESFEQAVEAVRHYSLRWQIELFHKVLKSGCGVEKRQLETAERLKRVLMIDMVVAWRILALARMGRETPGTPASALLAVHEWKALYSFIHKTGKAPKHPPDLGKALRWIGQLGGFLGRKGDGYPGPVVLWRGMQRLADIAQAWLVFNPEVVGNA